MAGGLGFWENGLLLGKFKQLGFVQHHLFVVLVSLLEVLLHQTLVNWHPFERKQPIGQVRGKLDHRVRGLVTT